MSGEVKEPAAFDKLLEEIEGLDTLQKSMSADLAAADDDKIREAAEDGNADADGDGKDDVKPEGKDDEGDDPMAKSFEVTLEGGEKVQALDAEMLVKSLTGRIEAGHEAMAKALSGTVKLIKSQGELIKAQGEMLKSLQSKYDELASSGRGRKAVLVPHEKKAGDDLTKSMGGSEQEGMKPKEFLAKAHQAYEAKCITGGELNTIDACLRMGTAPSAELIEKVANAKV